MQIHGLQKLTLLDFPGKMACTVFTRGCNMRCPFCHNASLVLDSKSCPPSISEDEFFKFLKKRSGVLDGVCISGGEPLLHPDIEEFINKIRDMGYLIKLDTNGSFPKRLKYLVSKGLIDYVAMDIKNAPLVYSLAVGIDNFDTAPIIESISFLLNNTVDYEFRTTAVKGIHTEEDFKQAAMSIKGAKRYYLQKFVDSGDLIGSGCSAFSEDEMENLLNIVSPYVAFAGLRGV